MVILIILIAGVGKSSLILSLVSEQFIEQLDNSIDIPAKLEPIVIPAEVTLENVPGVIIDYSKRDHSDKYLINEVQRADVICLVYAMNNEESKLKLSSYWLPKIYEINEDVRKPILIIGNKCDSCEKNIVHDPFISSLVARYHEIETCIECSAKSFKNVPEVFYYAQKSVLYPTAPLYNIEKKELTIKCRDALIRIFKLIDVDNDGVLNDEELNQFQFKCFGINIQPYALNEVKTVIKKKAPDGLVNQNLTLKGFLILNTLFVDKGRHETIWRILKHFGYDRYLNISKDYILNVQRSDSNCSIELSFKGFEFLKYLFHKYDQVCFFFSRFF
jgi:mitochondrial Rho GTPase 1